jgi:hypothetical protein
MDELELDFKAKLCIWDGLSPWYFITVTEKESSLIRSKFRLFHTGWGSIPVEVKVGGSI